MQSKDLLFFALMTALAAVASAPPLPSPSGRWLEAEAAPQGRIGEMQELAFQISMSPLP